MKVFATKYCLSAGIEHIEVDESSGGCSGGYVYERNERSGLGRQFRIGQSAFLTRDEAVANAELQRAARIASLRKSIAKLEKLNFQVAS